MAASRRHFIKTVAVGSAALHLGAGQGQPESEPLAGRSRHPIVLSTWQNGLQANDAAWDVLHPNGRALDAVEAGVRVNEADPNDQSVGYGGRPDREGHVTLDACIMDEFANIGAVACLEHIKHPISVARAVMEKTPHVMLVGQGALDFALSQGFRKENLLTADAERAWREWLETGEYRPKANIENHDTIGMIAMDTQGNLSGACTTSGMANKMAGRVGDSPIIGAGLFVDNEVGAAVATGHGEEVIRVVGSHLVVELMRQGKSPQKACEAAVKRIVHLNELRNKPLADLQIGFIALNKRGQYGAYALQAGFNYAVRDANSRQLLDAKHYLP